VEYLNRKNDNRPIDKVVKAHPINLEMKKVTEQSFRITNSVINKKNRNIPVIETRKLLHHEHNSDQYCDSVEKGVGNGSNNHLVGHMDAMTVAGDDPIGRNESQT